MPIINGAGVDFCRTARRQDRYPLLLSRSSKTAQSNSIIHVGSSQKKQAILNHDEPQSAYSWKSAASASTGTQINKSRSGHPPRRTHHQVTLKEDAMLVILKENNGRSRKCTVPKRRRGGSHRKCMSDISQSYLNRDTSSGMWSKDSPVLRKGK